MSTSTNTTNRDDQRNDVKVFAAAARSALEGYKREVQDEVDRKLAWLSEAERWAESVGPVPPRIARYVRLCELQEGQCAKGCSSRCKHSKANTELVEHYHGRIGFDFDAPVHTVFRMVAGDGPALDEAMDGLSSTIGNELNNSRVGDDIMTRAFADAGYVPPVANDEPDNEMPCGPELHDDTNVVNLEEIRLSKEIAELEQRANAQRVQVDAISAQIDEITRLVESRLPARPRHLTLVVSNDAHPSDGAAE